MVASSEAERRRKILDYLLLNSIKEKPARINKADVMRHLGPDSRPNSTHKTTVDLINEGKIKIVKDKPRSQTHYLVLDKENEFNKINEELLRLEGIINDLRIESPKFQHHYDLAVLQILVQLRATEKLPSQDTEVLYPKIIKLFSTLAVKKLSSMREADKQEKEEIQRRAKERAAAGTKAKRK